MNQVFPYLTTDFKFEKLLSVNTMVLHIKFKVDCHILNSLSHAKNNGSGEF